MAPQLLGRGAMVFVRKRKEKGMNIHNEDQPAPPIQLLVTAANGFTTAPGCSWLHGFCLLTCKRSGDAVTVTGKLMTGERFADDKPVIQALTRALDPAAVLAGIDLTGMIGRLGRLPIDAEDQRPALALLTRLKAMLVANDPIDLALTDRSRAALELVGEQNGFDLRPNPGESVDNANPARLAEELVDTAGAALLTVSELHLPLHQRPLAAASWRRWRADLQIAPFLFQMAEGGDPLV